MYSCCVCAPAPVVIPRTSAGRPETQWDVGVSRSGCRPADQPLFRDAVQCQPDPWVIGGQLTCRPAPNDFNVHMHVIPASGCDRAFHLLNQRLQFCGALGAHVQLELCLRCQDVHAGSARDGAHVERRARLVRERKLGQPAYQLGDRMHG